MPFTLFGKKTTTKPANAPVTTLPATKKKGIFQRWFGKKSKKISNRRQVFPTNESHKRLMIQQLRKVRIAESNKRKKMIAELEKKKADLNLPPENPFTTEGQNTANTLPFYKTNKSSVSRKKRNINAKIEAIKALRHKGSNTRIKTPSTANKIYRNEIKSGETDNELYPFRLEIKAPKTKTDSLDDIVSITNILTNNQYKLSAVTNLGNAYICTERQVGIDKRSCDIFADYNKIKDALLTFLNINKANISPEATRNAKDLFILRVREAIVKYIALAKQFSPDLDILPFIASEPPKTYIKYYYYYQYTGKQLKKQPFNTDFLFIITDTADSKNAKLHAFYRSTADDQYKSFKISTLTQDTKITNLIDTDSGKFTFPPSDESMGTICKAIAGVIKNYNDTNKLIGKLTQPAI